MSTFGFLLRHSITRFFFVTVAGLISLPALAQEVHFNQRPGERLDQHILDALDEAGEAAATGKPVTVDVLIFQFTHASIGDKIVDMVEKYPNLSVRLVGDWTSRNQEDRSSRGGKKYFTPSQNRMPFLDFLARGKYRDACKSIVQAGGKVPAFRPSDPDDIAIKEKYNEEMTKCIDMYRTRFAGSSLPNLQVRFKIDEPYTFNSRMGRATYNHAASKGLNHHKGLVVRVGGVPQKLVSGSYNWSNTAETSNYENLMVFDRSAEGSLDVMHDYAAEFDGFFFDNEVTLTLEEARTFGSWLRKKVVFDAGRGADPGPRPVRATPIAGTGSGAIGLGQPCNPGTDPNCLLINGLSGAAAKLEPMNVNNAGTKLLAKRLGITPSEASKIYQERMKNGPFTDAADLASRVSIFNGTLPDDVAKSVAFGSQEVSINEASADELEGIPRVGPVTARRIVEHREKFGEFESIEDLIAVRGIASRTLDRLRPFVNAAYSKVYFSSRRLGEEAGIGYSPLNGAKTVLVRKADSDEVERVAGVLTQPVIDMMRRVLPGETVRVAAYGLSSSTQEYQEIIEAARRGAKIQVVLNKQYSQGTVDAFEAVQAAENLDIEVRIPTRIMHEKFGFVGDDVFNGSANLSGSSSRKHSEDRFMFKNNPELTARFAERFEELWAVGRVRVSP